MKLLLGQNLKESDVLYISLASIYGIGKNMALQVCNRLGLSPMLRIYQIPNQKIAEIAKFLSVLTMDSNAAISNAFASNASSSSFASSNNFASRPQLATAATAATNDIAVVQNNVVVNTKNQHNKQNRFLKAFPILPTVTASVKNSWQLAAAGSKAAAARPLTGQGSSSTIRSVGFPLQIELKKHIRENINELISIKSYRGFRHVQHLPCRGQRTKTNAHTCKRVKPGA